MQVDSAALPRHRPLLRLLTCGSVDDGKSTLIGRLLADSQNIYADQLAALQRDSSRFGTTGKEIDYALLVDGLEAEREQGITIDVAYRYFSTMHRSFVVADTPGHEQYTRNMATGASNSDLAVILVDARKGIITQTRRHSYICSLLGIRDVVLAVNKMDLVAFDEAVFERIVSDYASFAAGLNFRAVVSIPLSARYGDNVLARSTNMPWFVDRTLLEHLEHVDVSVGAEERPFRFSVQWVNRPNLDFRGLAGTVASGQIKVGDPTLILPSGMRTTLERIVTADGDLNTAATSDAVTLVLRDDVDASRGDMLCSPQSPPIMTDQFAAHLIWMDREPLLPGRQYLLRIGNHWTSAAVTRIKHRVNVTTLGHEAATHLDLNEIAQCNMSTTHQVPVDAYTENRDTGAFILVDRVTHTTAAAGMIDFSLRRAANIAYENFLIDKTARAGLLQQRSVVLWFTGLSGSGKSTIANLIEGHLHRRGRLTYALDGDNIRHGLSRDLGFLPEDRVENIRRVGEVAKLFVDAGLIVLCSFISPFSADRKMVRDILSEGEFIEIFIDTPLDECARRDPKGLYAKVNAGKLINFTGFDSPYERPDNPDVILQTVGRTPEDVAAELLVVLEKKYGIL